MVRRYGAPWGREVIIVTVLGAIAMGLPLLVQLWRPRSMIVLIVVGGVLGTIALLCVRGYEVRPARLIVKRLLWDTVWPIDAAARATVRPQAMQGSWRVWGNGGMLAISGHFSGSGLGRYRAFVTDPDRTVVVETRAGIVVVSPDRPDDFARAIGDSRPAV